MSSARPRILIATGGSGGHLYPAFAVAGEIERRWPSAEVRLTIGHRDIEREICAAAGREARILPLVSTAQARRHPVRFLRSFWNSTRAATALLNEFRPDCVVGTGGFAMTPVVRTALRAKLPVVLLEQNAVPGRATRWFSRRAAAICSSFETLHPPLAGARVEVTGNPVRPAIAALAGIERNDSKTLLVLGGSQGARGLNEGLSWIASHHPEILARWEVVHQTGGDDSARELASLYTEKNVRARVSPFIVDIAQEYAQAELVIARAGATTLAELACAGTPAVLVPYPYARDRHQHANARGFADAGAAVVVEQAATAAETGAAILSALDSITVPGHFQKMSGRMLALAKPDAAARVAEVIERAIG